VLLDKVFWHFHIVIEEEDPLAAGVAQPFVAGRALPWFILFNPHQGKGGKASLEIPPSPLLRSLVHHDNLVRHHRLAAELVQ
jgi:hypothetical protein